MNKELEALYRLTSHECMTAEEFDSFVAIIKQALTPPTSDEVCKALSEYLGRKVTYNVSYQAFNDLIDKKWMRLAILSGDKVSITLYLPPHLIELIAKFYKNELEGKKNERDTI